MKNKPAEVYAIGKWEPLTFVMGRRHYVVEVTESAELMNVGIALYKNPSPSPEVGQRVELDFDKDEPLLHIVFENSQGFAAWINAIEMAKAIMERWEDVEGD